MPEIDLSDGLTPFRCGGHIFHVDLVGWIKWYAEVANDYAERPYALLDEVIRRLELQDTRLNYSQADAFLHALLLEYQEIKKKQHDERTCASSMGSMPSS
jgi:hypothetical protein